MSVKPKARILMKPTIQFVFPRRTVHLDFHIGPGVRQVGAKFDPVEFAECFRRAHVDSVTVFAKCHHGHLYYNTARPERHPGLVAGLDLLGQQIEALHQANIRAPVYLSVQCDEYAANSHPEWVAVDSELRKVKWGQSSFTQGDAFTAGWQILDMSSPYQDYLAEQVAEVLNRFAPLDGLFLDMCWDQPSCSAWAMAGMTRRGYDPRNVEHRLRYAREVAHGYMQRFRDMVDQAHRHAAPAGVWFNSRPKTRLHEEKKFLRHVEVECLPTGGWGYAYFPYVARFVRSTAHLPTLTHTGRFFKSWGDHGSLKPPMALKYECCQALSVGFTRGIGDLLPPSGKPNAAAYELIRSAYAYIQSCEPHVEDAELVAEIAVLVDSERGDDPGPSEIGAVRMLQQLKQQFDIIPFDHDVSSYAVVIVPESVRLDAPSRVRLNAFLASGGGLLVFGAAALDANGQPALSGLGFTSQGASPFSHTFLHVEGSIAEGTPDLGQVVYEAGFRMIPEPNTAVLARVAEPLFERRYDNFSGHDYTPEGALSPYAGIVQSGRAITFALPLLAGYGKHAVPNYRTIVGNCIRRLLPRPMLKVDGPSKLETTVMRRNGALVVHLLSFSPERRAEGLDIVEDALPFVNLPIAIRVESAPRRITLAPEGTELAFRYDAQEGYAATNITLLSGHGMIVIELDR